MTSRTLRRANSAAALRPFPRIAAALLAAALLAPSALAPTLAMAEEPTERQSKPLEEYLREQWGDSELQGALRDLLKSFEPVAKELDQMMRDLPRYESPEMLPNGDIIIRRKRGDEIET